MSRLAKSATRERTGALGCDKYWSRALDRRLPGKAVISAPQASSGCFHQQPPRAQAFPAETPLAVGKRAQRIKAVGRHEFGRHELP